MKPHTTWQAPFELFNDIDKESVKLLFELAEKRLKNILETSDRTTNRAYIVLTATIPLIAFLLSTLFRHYFGSFDSCLPIVLLAFCWITILVSLGVNVLLLKVAFPRDIHQVGREPRLLFTNELLTDSFYKGDKQFKMLLIYEIEDLQQRIDFMQIQGNGRVQLFKKAITILFGYAILCFTALMVLVLFQ